MKKICAITVAVAVVVSSLALAIEKKVDYRPVKKLHAPSMKTTLPQFEAALAGTLAFFDMEPDGDDFHAYPFKDPAAWHPDTYNAYGGSGQSYWCGNPETGGYDNGWYMTLDTPPIDLREAIAPITLEFKSFMDVECSGEAEGWDGGHVRVSTNGGNTFELLLPAPGYEYQADSCWAFDFAGEETPVGGYPCWNCTTNIYVPKEMDLTDYLGNQIIVRFVFAADQLMSTKGTDPPTIDPPSGQPTPWLSAWFVDDITVMDGSGALFFDDAGDTGPAQMVSGVKNLVNFESTTQESHSPTHSWHFDADDYELFDQWFHRWVETPWIDIPAQQYPYASYWVYCDMPDQDGDGDDLLDDYYYVYVRGETDPWIQLTADYGRDGAESGWELWDEDRLYNGTLRFTDYSGQKIKLGWVCRVDSNHDGGNGSGFFLDDVTILAREAPDNDVGIEHVVVPYPTSVNYTSAITGYIRNYGLLNKPVAIVYYFVEDGDGNKIGSDIPTGPPWPSIPSGTTLPWEFEYSPQDTGVYRVGFYQFTPDQYPPNDSGYSYYFRVYPEKEGYIAEDYRFSTVGQQVDAGEGPAVLFDPPTDIFPFSIQTLEIALRGTGDIFYHVYAASGPNDTIPDDGEELIDPISGSVPEHEGQAYYYVDVSDQEALQDMTGPFFLWVEMGAGHDLHWSSAPSPFPPTHSFVYDIENGWSRDENDYRLRCYVQWGQTGACEGLRGDPTGDGKTNVLDVLAVANHILGNIILSGDAFCRGDCTGDGTINILDALGVANVILGIIPECPGGACKPAVTPKTLEFMKTLESYLSPEGYAQIMAMVKGEMGVPQEYSLAQNYPNPFNPVTTITYSLPVQSGEFRVKSNDAPLNSELLTRNVSLKVYNVLGQEVATLVDEVQGPGAYTAQWDASDAASGVYFYRLTAGDYSATRQMVLMK